MDFKYNILQRLPFKSKFTYNQIAYQDKGCQCQHDFLCLYVILEGLLPGKELPMEHRSYQEIRQQPGAEPSI